MFLPKWKEVTYFYQIELLPLNVVTHILTSGWLLTKSANRTWSSQDTEAEEKAGDRMWPSKQQNTLTTTYAQRPTSNT